MSWMPNLILTEIADESDRAHAKHGSTSMRSQPWNHHRRVTILVEELGELAQPLNDFDHGKLTDREAMTAMRAEAVQVAAMAYDWIIALTQALKDPS